MAMRWPTPAVSIALTARTPVSNGWVTRARASGLSGPAGERPFVDRADRAEPVQRLAEPVDDAAEQSGADLGHAARRVGLDPRAIGMGGGAVQRHQQGAVAAEADHFGAADLAVGGDDARAGADRAGEAGRLQHQAVIGGEPADHGAGRRRRLDVVEQAAGAVLERRHCGAPIRSSSARRRSRRTAGPSSIQPWPVSSTIEPRARPGSADSAMSSPARRDGRCRRDGRAARRLDVPPTSAAAWRARASSRSASIVDLADHLRGPAGRRSRRAAGRARWRARAAAPAATAASRASASRSAAIIRLGLAASLGMAGGEGLFLDRGPLLLGGQRQRGLVIVGGEAALASRGAEARLAMGRARSCRGSRPASLDRRAAT